MMTDCFSRANDFQTQELPATVGNATGRAPYPITISRALAYLRQVKDLPIWEVLNTGVQASFRIFR